MSGFGTQKRGGAFNHYNNGHSEKHSRPYNPNSAPTGLRGQNNNAYQPWNKSHPTPQAGQKITQKDRTGEAAYFDHVNRLPDPQKCEPCKLAKQEVDAGLIALLAKVEAEELRPDGDKDILRSAGELRRLLSARNTKNHVDKMKELNKVRPSEGQHVMVPEYIEHKMELAKDLPPLPPILEPSLQEQVFTHISVQDYGKRIRGVSTDDLTYERLEFIGDAYLELLATRLIASRLGHIEVPSQAHFREQLVRNDTLSAFSIAYSLPDRLKHATHESGGKAWTKITADVFEAYVAAVILSDPVHGFVTAEKWLNQLWAPQVLEYREPIVIENPRAQEDLNKLVHVKGVKLAYTVEKDMTMTETGQQRYLMGVYLTGLGYENEWLGSGEGRNKQQASVCAAQDAIIRNSDVLQTAAKKKQELLVQQQRERDLKREELKKQAEAGDEEAITELRQVLSNDIRIKKKLAAKGDQDAAAKLEELIAEEAKLAEKMGAKTSTLEHTESPAKTSKPSLTFSAEPDPAETSYSKNDKKRKEYKPQDQAPPPDKKSTEAFLADIMAGKVDAKAKESNGGASWLEKEQKKKEKEERKKAEKAARKAGVNK